MARTEVGVWSAMGCLCVLTTLGCQARVGPRDGAVEQAARVAALESRIADLESALKETEAALSSTRASAASGEGMLDIGAVPQPTQLVEARGSAVRPNSASGSSPLVQWRVRTEDARGRFVQSTGPAEIVATSLADDGAAVEIGRWTVSAEAWRDSLREGLLGTAYAIDLTAESMPSEAQFLLIRMVLRDARLVEPLRLESAVPIVRPLSEAD
jgi:hypothetical protein